MCVCVCVYMCMYIYVYGQFLGLTLDPDAETADGVVHGMSLVQPIHRVCRCGECGRRGVKRANIRMTPGSTTRDFTQTLNPAHLTPAGRKRTRVQSGLHKRFVHFNAFVNELIIIFLPPPHL